MAKTVEEQLAAVQDALEAVETRGQRFTIKDRELWRADHASLLRREESLKKEAERIARPGPRITRIVPL